MIMIIIVIIMIIVILVILMIIILVLIIMQTIATTIITIPITMVANNGIKEAPPPIYIYIYIYIYMPHVISVPKASEALMLAWLSQTDSFKIGRYCSCSLSGWMGKFGVISLAWWSKCPLGDLWPRCHQSDDGKTRLAVLAPAIHAINDACTSIQGARSALTAWCGPHIEDCNHPRLSTRLW